MPVRLPESEPVATPSPAPAVRPVSGALFVGMLTIFWLEYLRPGNFLPGVHAMHVNTVVPLAVALATFLSRDGRPHAHVVRATDTKLFLVLLVLFVSQAFTADVRIYVFETLKGVAGYLLLYYMIVRHVTTLRRLKVVMATMALVHVVMIALYPEVVLDPETRHVVGGTFLGDGNDFAWSVCMLIPFALFLANTSAKPGAKVAYYGVCVVLLLAVVGTQSRGGSLALVASIGYVAMKSKRRFLAVTGIAALVAIVVAFAPSTYFDRMDTIVNWESEGSAQGRMLAWKSATSMALDHPITGVGAGHFGVKFGFEYKPAGYRGPYLNAHSIYFAILAEFGFPGLIILVALLAGNAVRNGRIIRSLQGRDSPAADVNRKLMVTMQASLIAYAVAGAFLSGVFYPHLFVLAALMEAARHLARSGAWPHAQRARLLPQSGNHKSPASGT